MNYSITKIEMGKMTVAFINCHNKEGDFVGVSLIPTSKIADVKWDKFVLDEKECCYPAFPAINYSFEDEDYDISQLNGNVSFHSSSSVKSILTSQDVLEDERYKTIVSTFSTATEVVKATAKSIIKYDKLCDVLTFQTTVKNGSERRTLTSLSSLCLSGLTPFAKEVDSDTIKVHELANSWSIEARLLTHTLADLGLFNCYHPDHHYTYYRVSNICSMPAVSRIPFLALEDTTSNVAWEVMPKEYGSWNIDVIHRMSSYCITCGGADSRNGWKVELAPNEEYSSNECVVACSDKGFLDVCNIVATGLGNSIAKITSTDELPVFFNEYLYSDGNPDMQNISDMVDTVKELGASYYIVDCGWYRNDSANWWNAIGDWNVNKKYFPNGLKEFSDLVRKKGMIPGIWFEFEGIGKTSQFYQEHPDLLIHQNGKIFLRGNRAFLDFRKPEVIKYLDEKVIKQLKDNNIGYIKVDYNSAINGFIDGDKAPAENLRDHLNAVSDFFKKIKREIPDIVIEICSAGGMRHSYAMDLLGSQISFSDIHFAKEGASIASGLHRAFPPKIIQIWSEINAKHSDYETMYHLAKGMLGTICLSGNLNLISPSKKEIVKSAVEFDRQIKDVVLNGKTTFILDEVKDLDFSKNKSVCLIRETNKEKVVYFYYLGDPAIRTYDIGNCAVIDKFGNCDYEISNGKLTISAKEDTSCLVLLLKK